MILTGQVTAVLDRRFEHEKAAAYYEGDVPEVFATDGLRRAMRATKYGQRLNFCRPVVDAVVNRLELADILAVSDKGTEVIGDTWEFNELGIDANMAHSTAGVYGESFATVWPDEDGNIEIAFSTPLDTAVVYDPERPRKKLYAVRLWEVEDGTRMNVFYADRIEKYKVSEKEITEGTNWSLIDTVENEFGEVPVFHFRTHRPFGRPEHKDAFDAQDYINKQFIQSMFTADYQGAPQRYALRKATESGESQDFQSGDTPRENETALQNGPGKLWDLVGYDKVGEFSPADPRVFWEPIKDTIRSMASTTNTPLHYFEKTGNVPSGEALRVAEAPLIKKVNDRKRSFGQTWRDLFKFVLRINGIEEDVQVKWQDVESLDELERLDAGLKKRNIGYSLRQVMREAGYDEEVIDRVIAEAADERAVGDVAGYERANESTTRNVRVQENNDERNVENG